MRSDAREAAFQIVFAELFHGNCDKQFKSAVYKKAKLSEEETAFADRLVTLTEEHGEELLAVIAEKATGFSEQRIYPVDKAIMLVALAEIKYCDDVPPVVSVSEAETLAGKFSTENSACFVKVVFG